MQSKPVITFHKSKRGLRACLFLAINNRYL